jgi:hypothetical protein
MIKINHLLVDVIKIVISSNIKLGEQSYDSSNNGNWRAGFV